MANVAKKVSWSGRDPRDDDDDEDGDGPAGESTPLLNGTGHGARQVGPGGRPRGSCGRCPGLEPSGGRQPRGEPGGAAAGPEAPGLWLRPGRAPPPTSRLPGAVARSGAGVAREGPRSPPV